MTLLFNSRRRALLISLGAITAVAAIACGSDDPPVRIPTPTPFPTSAAQPTATPIPATAVPTASVVPTVDVPLVVAPTAVVPAAIDGGAGLTSDNFTWVVDEVGVGTKPAIALDPEGNPIIAFMLEAQMGFVLAAEIVYGAWVESLIAEGYFYGPLDVDVNPDGVAYVAWHDHQAEQFQQNLGRC